MNIALTAQDKKKELLVQFCIAYKSILAKHNLFATATTGRLIADATGLPITMFLSHKNGGHQQIDARIAYGEIDLVFMFTDPDNRDPWEDQQVIETLRRKSPILMEVLPLTLEEVFLYEMESLGYTFDDIK